ncbi:TOBE domain-containing protein [Nitratireductor pacificus]|uniref:Glycerol-3-phosphate transporter ATP-binding subunit n=1 Tax=Nitratireductor pacificus pht-3B TaxID=391937 RepID=K2LNH0_9HYPH|nr:glycerol-3-phosphate transporter ATP-binding subunit [Nitratireductor pacificus pht-3B]
MRQPSVFLFDEPLSNLDAKLRVQMRLEIKQMQRSVGTTALYVTHDQVEAMTLADRLVVMNAGIAEQIDTPMAVYERPATRFVAGFIGSPAMNILKGSAAGADFVLDGGARLTLAGAAPAEAGRPLLFGVRPEHLRLVPAGEAALALSVTAIETLGADTLAHGRLSGADGGDAGELIARLPGNARLALGDTLPLAIEPGMAHLFDAETGRRV